MLVGNFAMKEEQMGHKVRNLFSKFSVSENPTLSDYVSSIPDTLSEAINILLSPKFANDYSATDYTIANRRQLGHYLKRFQSQANTLSEGVIDSIGLQ